MLTITTKPGKKYASLKRPDVYEALRRQGMSKQRAARISNAQANKDAGAVAGPMLSGPSGLLGTPGMGRRGRKWGNRRKAKACTCGVNVATKEQLSPGVTRIRGNLCNVHGRYGPCDAGASAAKKPKGKKGRATKKPIKTPAQRLAERQAKQIENRSKVLSGLGIGADGQKALEALRSGGQPDAAAILSGGFEQAGLVERAADGSYRLTASGRAAMNAANAGDQGRAGDIISSARDRLGARQGRQAAAEQRKQEVAARRAEAEAARKKRAEEAAKKRGGGSKQTGGRGGADSGAYQRQQREAERQSDRERRLAEHEADRARRDEQDRTDRTQQQPVQRATAPPERVSGTRPGVVGPSKRRGRLQRTNVAERAKSWGVTYKRSNAELRAMFAKMGGGKKGGGGKGGGAAVPSDASKLWPKDPTTGRREDPGLFGHSYQERQTALQGKFRQREEQRAASDKEREAFFNRQSQSRTTTAPAGPKIVAQPTKQAMTSATHELSKPERYHELEQLTQRTKMPQAGWNQSASDKQKSYLGSLAERARLGTKEGGETRALADEIIRLNKSGKLTKWEASQLIDAMNQPKPMSTLLNSARSGIRSGSDTDRWRALLASDRFRIDLLNHTLNREATEEGLPF